MNMLAWEVREDGQFAELFRRVHLLCAVQGLIDHGDAEWVPGSRKQQLRILQPVIFDSGYVVEPPATFQYGVDRLRKVYHG